MTKAEKIAANKLEKEIDAIYKAHCAGIEIDIFDIEKVFAEGRKARAEGRNMKDAIVAFVQTIRKN